MLSSRGIRCGMCYTHVRGSANGVCRRQWCVCVMSVDQLFPNDGLPPRSVHKAAADADMGCLWEGHGFLQPGYLVVPDCVRCLHALTLTHIFIPRKYLEQRTSA
eukprot:m.758967 g.758967  ORF g.758967 m.758967 type:complete len:104 (-) comp23194_c0_seq9:2252-2563(-)